MLIGNARINFDEFPIIFLLIWQIIGNVGS